MKYNMYLMWSPISGEAKPSVREIEIHSVAQRSQKRVDPSLHPRENVYLWEYPSFIESV